VLERRAVSGVRRDGARDVHGDVFRRTIELALEMLLELMQGRHDWVNGCQLNVESSAHASGAPKVQCTTMVCACITEEHGSQMQEHQLCEVQK
jgi:hypothetical protein